MDKTFYAVLKTEEQVSIKAFEDYKAFFQYLNDNRPTVQYGTPNKDEAEKVAATIAARAGMEVTK